MNWIPLTKVEELEVIDKESFSRPVVIFKHSTTCSISHMAKGRLDRSKAPANISFYYLDLKQFRSVSNAVASHYDVAHESPQVILVANGKCVYDESHNGITMDEIEEQAMQVNF